MLLPCLHQHTNNRRVAASFVSQLLVTNEEGRTNFNVPPFLLTYLSTSVFTIFLPLVQLKSLLQETWLLRSALRSRLGSRLCSRLCSTGIMSLATRACRLQQQGCSTAACWPLAAAEAHG
jgi:hypothetical protein